MNAGDPYVAVGLAHNPFVAEQTPGVAERHYIDVGVPDPPARGVVEVVGARGAGKTTHLLRWCRQRGGTYHHVERGPGRLRPLPVADVVAWDEVDRVPPTLLRVVLRSARRRGALVMLGTHRPTGLADISHAMPTATPEAVQQFFAARVAAVAVRDVPHPAVVTLSSTDAAAVVADGDGTWRTVGTTLHVLIAKRVRDVTGS